MNEYGCLTSFDTINLQAALIMIFVDAILFGLFCYKWYQIVKKLKPAETGNKIPSRVWQGFAVQFICVIVAMSSCSIDGVINYLYMDYDTLLIFVVDCAIVATANFAMLKESKQCLLKQLRTVFCVDIICQSMAFNKNIGNLEKERVTSDQHQKNIPTNTKDGVTIQQLPSESHLKVNTNATTTTVTCQESQSQLNSTRSGDDSPNSQISTISRTVDSEVP